MILLREEKQSVIWNKNYLLKHEAQSPEKRGGDVSQSGGGGYKPLTRRVWVLGLDSHAKYSIHHSQPSWGAVTLKQVPDWLHVCPQLSTLLPMGPKELSCTFVGSWSLESGSRNKYLKPFSCFLHPFFSFCCFSLSIQATGKELPF